nr:nucleotidyl transferase AbiEii/AbiGii toxin family protein [Vitiosangium sp. GDMCC 1.1324]
MSSHPYRTSAAFKQALEARLRAAAASSGMPMNRLRQRLIFDRFLVRVFAILGENTPLKGGIALELRLSRARTTKDVDLRCTGKPDALLGQLQAAGRTPAEEPLFFEVSAGPQGDIINGEGVVYEGRRFRVHTRLDGRPYGEPFGVDAAFGDVLVGTPETIEGSDFLSFAGVPRSRLRIYPRESHVAEKLHAYTLPRERENERTRE